jgi:hypothetical protein
MGFPTPKVGVQQLMNFMYFDFIQHETITTSIPFWDLCNEKNLVGAP